MAKIELTKSVVDAAQSQAQAVELRDERVKKRAPYAIVRTTPPSTRKEVPVVADACSEQT
ncbi:hypothetical protein GCM10027065_28830 [Rhodanobacter koreensis]